MIAAAHSDVEDVIITLINLGVNSNLENKSGKKAIDLIKEND